MKPQTRSAATPAGPELSVAGGSRVRHILLILPTFFPEVYGGAERQASILAMALHGQGVGVTIVAPTIRARSSVEETPFGRVVRFHVKAYPNFGGRRSGSTLSWVIKVAAWAWIHRGAFDIIYVFHGRLHALAGAAASAVTGKPMLMKLGGSGEGFDFVMLSQKRGGYGGLAAKLLLHQTSGFVANSVAIVDDLSRFGVEAARIFSFPNGVSTPSRAAVELALATRNGRRFIFTGRVDEEKGIGVLIEALALRQDMGAQLTVVGEGAALEDLRRQAQGLGVGDRVIFRGRVDEIYPELLAHDFFISASTREGQSNALLEGMAAGCVPVVANASGVAEVVESGRNGLIVDGSTPKAFSDAISAACGLAVATRVNMSLAAHDFVSQNLDIDLIARKTVAVADSVLKLSV